MKLSTTLSREVGKSIPLSVLSTCESTDINTDSDGQVSVNVEILFIPLSVLSTWESTDIEILTVKHL